MIRILNVEGCKVVCINIQASGTRTTSSRIDSKPYNSTSLNSLQASLTLEEKEEEKRGEDGGELKRRVF